MGSLVVSLAGSLTGSLFVVTMDTSLRIITATCHGNAVCLRSYRNFVAHATNLQYTVKD